MADTGAATILYKPGVGDSVSYFAQEEFPDGALTFVTKPLDMQMETLRQQVADLKKYFCALQVDIEGARDGIFIRFGYMDRIDDEPTWLDFQSLTAGNEPVYLPQDVEARYCKLELKDTAPTSIWKLSRIHFFGEILDGNI